MNLNISDDLTPEKRREILEVYPIIYALYKHQGCLVDAARFLGISRRGLFEKIRHRTEIMGFLNKGPLDYYPNQFAQDPLKKIYQYHISKTEKSFWYNGLSAGEKLEVQARIKRLYTDFI